MANHWRLSIDAAENIQEIMQSVASFTGHWTSAAVLLEDLQAKFDLIAFMPKLGKPREDGTRETFCRGYRIIYQQIEDDIYIITIIHSRRLYPRN
ncbi:MAG: type II toxin-antitoxin system RelE/ParE family toxin [Pasteurellaceae bacterium]|nr:type II toxin-antitoxin system RelE/ParE family toxin [Pasteurellaceae bacterium]